MPWDLTDYESTLVQVMAWCRQATSHYLSQGWPRSVSPYDVTRAQWVNIALGSDVEKNHANALIYASRAHMFFFSALNIASAFLCFWQPCIWFPLTLNFAYWHYSQMHKIVLHSLFRDTERWQLVIFTIQVDSNISISHCQYHGYRWSGNADIHVMRSHCNVLVLSKYFDLSTNRVYHKFSNPYIISHFLNSQIMTIVRHNNYCWRKSYFYLTAWQFLFNRMAINSASVTKEERNSLLRSAFMRCDVIHIRTILQIALCARRQNSIWMLTSHIDTEYFIVACM